MDDNVEVITKDMTVLDHFVASRSARTTKSGTSFCIKVIRRRGHYAVGESVIAESYTIEAVAANRFHRLIAELESALVLPLNDPLFQIVKAKYRIDDICALMPIDDIPADLRIFYKLKFG